MAICALVGRGRSSDFHTRVKNNGKLAFRRSSKAAVLSVMIEYTRKGVEGPYRTVEPPMRLIYVYGSCLPY
jgi:hypothetical protein